MAGVAAGHLPLRNLIPMLWALSTFLLLVAAASEALPFDLRAYKTHPDATPAGRYVFAGEWQATRNVRWLKQARGETPELPKHPGGLHLE